ncbi:hypothetical protein PR202_gb04666 [Eleusine coracana subsp. coracana]|uniref:Uncharacterized protein n=1 Tax=Eleusine coracana subsp. coracana TaxID=191504 RepID=A0AAV5E4E6_ELECO|nr:hypothetical protein PR202_gb04666 [Eleusine coracana subsp. coracana]
MRSSRATRPLAVRHSVRPHAPLYSARLHLRSARHSSPAASGLSAARTTRLGFAARRPVHRLHRSLPHALPLVAPRAAARCPVPPHHARRLRRLSPSASPPPLAAPRTGPKVRARAAKLRARSVEVRASAAFASASALTSLQRSANLLTRRRPRRREREPPPTTARARAAIPDGASWRRAAAPVRAGGPHATSSP